MSNTHHLAALIEDIADERGWSIREVARRAGLPAATVQKIVTRDKVTVPRRDTLEALAYGLSVPVSVLADAAAKDSGYKTQAIQEDQATAVVIAAMEELPQKRKEEIAALALAMLRSQRDEDHS